MKRYDIANAASKINGYFVPPRATFGGDTVQSSFEEARKQCAERLRQQLEDVEKLTLEQFLMGRRV